MINSHTQAVVLLGDPVTHSLSPLMQNAAFKATGLNCAYLATRVKQTDIAIAVAAIPVLGFVGANVTVPHKKAVLPLMDVLHQDCQLIGAVNTIVNDNGKLKGYNTDSEGFMRALGDVGYQPEGARVIVLGAGGAARAVVVGMALRGVKEINIFNRSRAKAVALARQVQELGVSANVYDWSSLITESDSARQAFINANLIVQTTSLGMPPMESEYPPVPLKWLTDKHLVYDLVYNPPETKFLNKARQSGAKTVNGLGMLLYQGVTAFELWTRCAAPVELMRTVLRNELGR